VKTKYPKPSEELLWKSLDDIWFELTDDDWKWSWVPTEKVRMTEHLAIPIESLVEKMHSRPEKVPPIIVTRMKSGGFRVLDGHHRLLAAWLAGRKKLWVVEILQ
jgi:hypothetical protein